MKCKSCHKNIPEGSNFCNWCGVRQGRAPKQKDEIRVPEPKKTPSGKWRIQLRAEGESVTEDTAAKCVAKARAIRAGFIEQKKKTGAKLSLGDAIDTYISNTDNLFSPATKRGYSIIRRNRFQAYMDVDIKTFTDWQAMVNDEKKVCSAKTLYNAWGLVSAVLNFNKITPPKVKLSQVIVPDQPWLTYEQIPLFCKAIYGEPCELGALLALSSLRRSELCAVTPDHVAVDGSSVLVSGAIVPDENNTFVHKDENKTQQSRRTVPVFIPRLRELLCAMDRDCDFIVSMHPDTLRKRVNAICKKAGLPEVGLHGLRRSFASLGHHLGLSEQEVMAIGGWEDYQTVHKHYLKLSAKDHLRGHKKMERYYTKNANLLSDFHSDSANPHE